MEDMRPKFAAGLRRISLASLNAGGMAERFGGLPASRSRGQMLAAFKRAASCLGIAPRLRDAVDVLMSYSQAQDWEAGSRPIVWPSNAALQEHLGLCKRQVQYLLRMLIDARLIVAVDSPTGRRWGRRHPTTGRIIEAYGFDLAPLAVRYPEFEAAAERARADRAARAALRRRLTIALKAIRQIGETALTYGLDDRDWEAWTQEAIALARGVAEGAGYAPLEAAVADLEARRNDGENLLTASLCPEDTAPTGATDCIPITTTNQLPADQSATRKPSLEISDHSKGAASTANKRTAPVSPELEEHTISPWFILKVSPALKPYIVSAKPTWADIIEAADWVRGDLGISRYAWIEACMTMGRYNAATAIAVIAAKANEISSAGGYLRAMTERARQGSLHLGKSVYGLAEKQRQQRI
jgi:replication initiation protein RepC